MIPLPLALGVIAAPFLVAWFIARPTRTIIPLYAGVIPIGSAFSLSVPLPPPFDTVSSVLGAMAIGAGIVHIVLYKDGRIPTIATGLWCAFLGWGALTALWALEPANTRNLFLVAGSLVLLLVVVALLPWDRTDFDVLRLALVLSGVAVGLYAIFLLASGSSLPSHQSGGGERLSVVTNAEDSNPNILAASLLLPLALALEMLVTGGRRWWSSRVWRSIGLSGLVLTLVSIFLTGSRGGLIAAGLVMLVTFYHCSRIPYLRAAVVKVIASLVLLAATTVVAALAVRYIYPDAAESIAARVPVNRIQSAQTSGRNAIWATGFMACGRFCAWGAGMGNFRGAYTLYYPYSGSIGNVGLDRPAHNTYFQLVVETGAVGIALLFGALILEWRSMSTPALHRLTPALRAGLLGLLVSEFFLTAIWFKFFWVVFVYTRAAERTVMDPEAAAPGRVLDEPSLLGPGPGPQPSLP